jgi:hypothetical protein
MRMGMTLLMAAALCAGTAHAGDPPKADGETETKTMSGMSVLGNNDAPKSLVIVPWRSSEIGDGIGVVDSLSNRPMPVDRDVFDRELRYYDLRTEAPSGVATSDDADLRVGSR